MWNDSSDHFYLCVAYFFSYLLLTHVNGREYAGQEATVTTGHGTTDWFQIGKGVRQGCILSPCLFNLYAEYIMRNAGLEEAQAGIKIAGRNINHLRYADDTWLVNLHASWRSKKIIIIINKIKYCILKRERTRSKREQCLLLRNLSLSLCSDIITNNMSFN